MTQRIITGTVKAQLVSCYGPEDLKGDDKRVFNCLTFSTCDMSEHGYAVVGSAEITVTLNDTDTIISDKIEALRAEATKVKAEAHARVVNIERKINDLLMIALEPEVP